MDRHLPTAICLLLRFGVSPVAAAPPDHLAPALARDAPPARVVQIQDGEIFGEVTDAAGSALPGVAVTIGGAALLAARNVTTTGAGSYSAAQLPAGVYTVVFELPGFVRLEYRDVRLVAGFHARVDARLHPSLARNTETLVAVAREDLVDTRSTSVTMNVLREQLERLPSGHDPDAILECAPGITATRCRDAGELAVDGITIGRHAERGWTSGNGAILFEGIQAQLASADASVQNSGRFVNLVTRSGSNRFKGSARYSLTDRRLQSDNMTDALRAQGAGFGSPVRRASELAGEAGGPIARDKAWAWGAASGARQDVGIIGFYTAACLDAAGRPAADARYRAQCMQPDITRLLDVTGKVQYQWRPAARLTALWARSEKRKPRRGASAYARLESTTRQSDLGMAQPFQLQHQWVPSRSWVVDAKYSFSDGSFLLDFQDPRLVDVQGAYDRYTLMTSRSATQARHIRRTSQAQVAGTAYRSGLLAGDHSVKFGVEFADQRREQIDRTGGGAVAVFDSVRGAPAAYQARVFRDGHIAHRERQWSAFIQDSFRRGRVTINAGARIDRQDDAAMAATIPANPILPDLLPAVRFAGADSGIVYSDLSPRVGVAWDLTGRGGTVVKVSAVRSRASGNATSAPLQPTRQTRLVYWWNDANGDAYVQRDELDVARGPASAPTSNYDVANPRSVVTPATIAPSLVSVISDQFTLGVERRLAARLVVRANYVARHVHRLQSTYRIEADGSPVATATFSPVTWAPGGCLAGAECPTVTYYERAAPLPAGTVVRNDGRYAWHHDVDLVVHKRLSAGWMLDVSLTWSRAALFFPEPTRDYTDPTNIAMRDGTEYSLPGARWTAKISGMVRLPWRLATAMVFTAREGYPYDRAVSSPARGRLSSTNVSIQRYGSVRYPDVYRLDWRVDRAFTLGRLEVVPTVNVFNACNSNAVLSRNRVQNSPTANDVVQVVAPRSIRLDFAISW